MERTEQAETPERVWRSDAKNKLEIARRYAESAKEVLSQIETTPSPMRRVSLAIDDVALAIHRIDMAIETEDHCAEREIADEEARRSARMELDRRRAAAESEHERMRTTLLSVSTIPQAIKEMETAWMKMSRYRAISISAKPRKASVSRTGETRSSRSAEARTPGKSSSRSEGRRSRSSKPRASSGRASRRKGG